MSEWLVSPLIDVDIDLTSSEKLLTVPALRNSCLDKIFPFEFIRLNTSSIFSFVELYYDIANR